MSSGLRHACIAVAIVALALLSHGALMRAGWLGGDLDLLQRVQSGAPAADAASEPIRTMPMLVLRAHEHAFGEHGIFAPLHARSLRAVSLVLLLATAAAAGFALRRALLPWIGGDTARAAGFALALLFATHPLGSAVVARPAALGDLLALFFACLAASLFLRGRQEHQKQWVVLAAVGALLAGFSSPVALLLPFVLAGLELASAQRPRPMLARLRTAATTLFVFLGCVLVHDAYAGMSGIERGGSLSSLGASGGDPLRVLAACVEKLGIVFLPVPITHDARAGVETGPSPWPNYLVAFALVLIALLPVLRSARAAPRLWGRLGLAWIVAMAIALLPHAAVRLEPGDDSQAEILATATLFACAGLATASTALLGTRRILLPAAISIGFAWLGAQSAGGFVRASRTVASLRADMDQAALRAGREAHVLVLDPIERSANLDLGLRSPGLLVDRRAGAAQPVHEPAFVSGPALYVLARTSEFAAWRKSGIVLVEALAPAESDDANAVRRITQLQPTSGSTEPVVWLHSSRSGLFDVDPGAQHAARFTAQAGTSTAEAPRMAWRAEESVQDDRAQHAGAPAIREAIGVWLAGDGDAPPSAVFDLVRDFDWWTATSIRQVWTKSPFTQVASGELVPDLPLEIEGAEPVPRGDDWTFRVDRSSLRAPLRGEAGFVLDLLDLATLDLAHIEVEERSGTLEPGGVQERGDTHAHGDVDEHGNVDEHSDVDEPSHVHEPSDVPEQADLEGHADTSEHGTPREHGDIRKQAVHMLELTAPGAAGFERLVRERGGGPLVWSLDRRVGDTTVARASGRVGGRR